MQTKLLFEHDLPLCDTQIAQFVADYGFNELGGKTMLVGIQYKGKVYRHIACEGLSEYLSCVEFLAEQLQLTDLLANRLPLNGLDSLFAVEV